jgi:hypothetical protein
MSYTLFDGDDELAFFVVACGDMDHVKELKDYYETLGYDCSGVSLNENVVPNVIVRPKEKMLLPCGASMSALLSRQGVVFKQFAKVWAKRNPPRKA